LPVVVEAWRCGGVEVWRCGGVEVSSRYTSTPPHLYSKAILVSSAARRGRFCTTKITKVTKTEPLATEGDVAIALGDA